LEMGEPLTMPHAIGQRNLIFFGISPNLFLNASGQFSISSPFWLKNAEVHLSRAHAAACIRSRAACRTRPLCEALGILLPVDRKVLELESSCRCRAALPRGPPMPAREIFDIPVMPSWAMNRGVTQAILQRSSKIYSNIRCQCSLCSLGRSSEASVEVTKWH
jgi:hypothetical protein